ncbi:hypothetical protein DB32_005637 [Sandaracinus amylolyticus]|uniref:Uncharacterized protein n=1 Tax=Sandaracinus amylolyticus TaxID=927083 RepID=A0A0F6YLM2_9BACT|nr:hypothetical protein DB32_005637 [Sandaracinus amylolyticus]
MLRDASRRNRRAQGCSATRRDAIAARDMPARPLATRPPRATWHHRRLSPASPRAG